MADISKIKLSGTDYDIKDNVARQASTENGASINTITNRLNSQGNTINSINSSVSTLTGKVSTLESSDTAQNSAISNLQTTVAGVSNTAGANSQNIATLTSRMNGFSNLPSGSTAGDAELADIRVGFNNRTYGNAGTAVREQAKSVGYELVDDNLANVLLPYYSDGTTANGVTITRVNDVYHLSGTASANFNHNIIVMDNYLPIGLKGGDEIMILVYSTKSRTQLGIEMFYNTTGGGNDWQFFSGFADSGFTDRSGNNIFWKRNLVSGTRGILIRLVPKSGVTYNDDVTVKLIPVGKGERSFNEKGTLPSGNLNDIYKAGYYLLIDANTYTGIPADSYVPGFLKVYPIANAILQEYIPWDAGKIYARITLNSLSNWGDWQRISGGGGQTVNNIYQNTYNVTASPSITSDTNNYLAPTGNTSDRTNDIATMLTQNGVCRLGGGDYYVSNLVMPDNTMLIGSGNKTRIICSSGNFAVKLGTKCSVKDLSIWGSLTNITVNSSVGSKHGILWQGTYSIDQASTETSVIENVYIGNFNGGGICCDNTGYGTASCIHVTDVFIVRCDCGVYVKYWSEFNKFENVSAKYCYYGCINNGGNNMFANCDFSSNTMALLMDNQNNQSPNNSHGSYVGCVFNHSGGNAGYGIQILNCDSGTVFDGCQIFFSKTKLVNSDGVTISNSNFGANNCDIEVNGGGAVLFIGNMFQSVPTIDISNNTHVVFANNYVRSTGAVVSA